ncbi:MAG: SHOCT domain-containing protein [Chloroflexi bacterium]|nr:SHOCT domain-containing protein [Chloroflexota bacterium]
MTGWTMGTEAWIWMGAWALVMVLVVWLLVREPRQETHDDPDAILRARFARGEISEEEFTRATALLDSDPPIPPANGARHNAARHAHDGQEARYD